MFQRFTSLTRLLLTSSHSYNRILTPIPVRFFAKQKGKKPKEMESESVEINFDIDSIKQEMKDSIDKLDEQLNKIRIGRVDPRMLDEVWVNDVGSSISDIAQVTPKGSTELLVKVFDSNHTESAYIALNSSSLNLMYRKDATGTIFVTVPKPTQELKDELNKKAKHYTEDAKNAVRNYRKNALQELKKAKDVGKDDLKRLQNEVQQITDQFCGKADELISSKERQIKQF